MKKLMVSLLLCWCCGSVVELSMGMKDEQQANKQQIKAFRCISRGDIEGLKQLILKGGVDINKSNERGKTLLESASKSIYSYNSPMADLVTFLILNGANIRNENGYYYRTSRISLMPMDVLISDIYINVSCLVAVAKNQKIDIYNYPCCKEGANIFLSAISSNRRDIVKYLSDTNYAIWNSRDKYGAGPLHYAVDSKSLEIVAFVLDNGADVNEANNKGQTVLHKLAYSGDSNISPLFLKQLGKANNKGQTVLYKSAYPGNANITPLLLKRPNFAYSGDANILQFFLKQPGIELNKQDIDGNTPLHVAVHSGYSEVVASLLNCTSINFDLTNNKGLTPFYLVISEIFNRPSFAIDNYLRMLKAFAKTNRVPCWQKVEEFLNSKNPNPEKQQDGMLYKKAEQIRMYNDTSTKILDILYREE